MSSTRYSTEYVSRKNKTFSLRRRSFFYRSPYLPRECWERPKRKEESNLRLFILPCLCRKANQHQRADIVTQYKTTACQVLQDWPRVYSNIIEICVRFSTFLVIFHHMAPFVMPHVATTTYVRGGVPSFLKLSVRHLPSRGKRPAPYPTSAVIISIVPQSTSVKRVLKLQTIKTQRPPNPTHHTYCNRPI